MDRKIRAVVVDDERLARLQLSGLLSAEPDVEIIGVCSAGHEAIALLKSANPDVVFLDVQLPDAGGFEVLAALDPETLPLVVFVTEYGQYAARAFELGVIDYLLKPFDSRRFTVALERVRKELRRDSGNGAAPAPHANGNGSGSSAPAGPVARSAPRPSLRGQTLERIMVKDRGRIYFVRTVDIDWIESADNYVRIHVGKDVHLIRHSLKYLGACLDTDRFARIHRCTIVNLDRVQEIQPGVGREHILILEDGTRLKLGQRYRRHLERQAALGK